MRIVNKDNFSLGSCVAGVPCHTRSGKEATFLFIQTNSLGNKVNAPVVMVVGNRMENFTTDGKHIDDGNLDLYMPDPVDWNIYSPTSNNAYNFSLYKSPELWASTNCLNLGFAENKKEPDNAANKPPVAKQKKIPFKKDRQ